MSSYGIASRFSDLRRGRPIAAIAEEPVVALPALAQPYDLRLTLKGSYVTAVKRGGVHIAKTLEKVAPDVFGEDSPMTVVGFVNDQILVRSSLGPVEIREQFERVIKHAVLLNPLEDPKNPQP